MALLGKEELIFLLAVAVVLEQAQLLVLVALVAMELAEQVDLAMHPTSPAQRFV
jgi:hypothetical protein